MPDSRFPVTRLTLIRALGQGLRWEEFVALYGQLILLWARHDFGLQVCDAENVRQEVLLRVWRAVGQYEASRGRFRHWLRACTRNAVRDLWRTRQGEPPADSPVVEDRPRASTAPAFDETGDLDAALDRLESEGFAREDLQRAVLSVRSKVQPATWRAFLLFEFLDLRAREIAPRLGLSPAAVNQAVFRVRQLLQQAIEGPKP